MSYSGVQANHDEILEALKSEPKSFDQLATIPSVQSMDREKYSCLQAALDWLVDHSKIAFRVGPNHEKEYCLPGSGRYKTYNANGQTVAEQEKARAELVGKADSWTESIIEQSPAARPPVTERGQMFAAPWRIKEVIMLFLGKEPLTEESLVGRVYAAFYGQRAAGIRPMWDIETVLGWMVDNGEICRRHQVTGSGDTRQNNPLYYLPGQEPVSA